MAKIRCKGTSLKQEISSVYTAVAQITSMESSGSETITFDGTTLDGGIAKEHPATGYAESGEVSGELFYDPALSGHQSFTDLIERDVTAVGGAANNFRITYADTAATTHTFSVTGVGAGIAVQMDDGLKMKFKLKISGTAGWPS